MLKSEILNLPTSDELLCSDETPVDNEDQNFIPNFLLFLLDYLWGDRQDWFFGVDMAIYHTRGKKTHAPTVPDGFLALNVERRKGGKSRKSYVMWEENNIVPLLALEVVSSTPGGEYSKKEKIYARWGVRYYVIYNPQQYGPGQHRPLEMYKLVNGTYRWQDQEPMWMPEIGLGIGRSIREYKGSRRELLYWFNEQGNRYVGTEEELEFARKQVRQEEEQRKFAEQETELQRERAESAEQQVERERERAEFAQQQVERERERAEFAQQQVERERERAEFAEQQAEQERQLRQQEQQQRELAQQQTEHERERAERLQRELERYRQQLGDLPEP